MQSQESHNVTETTVFVFFFRKGSLKVDWFVKMLRLSMGVVHS